MGDASDSKPRLGDILIKLQLVDEVQVEEALDHQAKSGKLFGESLLDLGFVGEDDLSWALSSQLGLPFVAATPEMVDPQLILRYPTEFLRGHLVLPLVATDTTLSVVLADPTDKTTLARLERISGLELSMAVGTPSGIKRALDSVLGETEEADKPRPRKESKSRPASLSSPELMQLVDQALTRGASSVHLDPDGNRVRVLFRSPVGELTEGDDCELDFSRDLVLALRQWLGEGNEQAPGVTVWTEGPHSDHLPFRAMAFDGSDGPSLTLIMDDSYSGRHKLAAAYEEDWGRFDELLARPCGLIVAVAPTQHGREQALARLLSRLDASRRRICALVDDAVPLPRRIIRFSGAIEEGTTGAFCRMTGVDVLAGVFSTSADLTRLAESAGRDRLAIAAFPGNSALGFLSRMREAGVSSTLLSEALLVVVAQQTLIGRDETTLPRAVTETLFVERPLRIALQGGGHIEALRQAAVEQGFKEIAVRARDLDEVDETVLKDLERHRYLEDAA